MPFWNFTRRVWRY